MKRIALLILAGFSLIACDNKVDPEPGPGPWGPEEGEGKSISLKIHVPPRSTSTYAEEDPSEVENKIDSIFIYLYQAGTFIHEGKFGGSQLDYIGPGDSTILIAYEVDNITTGALTAEVFANKRKPTRLTSPNEVPIPDLLQKSTLFYMSGKCTALTFNTSAYYGEVHIVRNVAKLRTHVTKAPVTYPSDLTIDYNNISIQILNATDSTTAFGDFNPSGINYFNYNVRTGGALRKPSGFNNTNGGFLDSLYLYENLHNKCEDGESGTTHNTKILITIPTNSATEGYKVMTVTYELKTNLTGFCIKRNYIYTLDIKVRSQSPDPLIMLDILPWDNIDIDGSIPGTYLNLNTSEIRFDGSGVATINFCSDAQAIYFDFEGFNGQNTPQIGTEITPIGIETPIAYPDLLLAPQGFRDGQILLDQQHCGSFSFRLEDLANNFPGFPNVNFSGSICMKAGNIVKCLTFPAVKTFDAHFIVGEPLFFPNESFTTADVAPSAASWMEVSPNRLYYLATPNYSNSTAVPLYLHLDENLTGSSRTGSITLQNSATGVSKVITISQLPAIPVGPFGYDNTTTHSSDSIYERNLYTEQLYEFNVMPRWWNPVTSLTSYNPSIFNGFQNFAVINTANYNTPPHSFDHAMTGFEAVNYCAYKNRGFGANGTLRAVDLKWYLPSQAQLMAMWIFDDYNRRGYDSNFRRATDTLRNYWGSTPNVGFSTQAELVNFDFGNVGHYERGVQNWVRCVRDGTYISKIVRRTSSSPDYPSLNFRSGFIPHSASTTDDKVGITSHESQAANLRVYAFLRVAKQDLTVGGETNFSWAIDLCKDYNAEGPGTWRLPTQRELQAIWIMQHELRAVMNPSSDFNLLSNDYYWSGTDASTATGGSNAWTVFGTAANGFAGAGNTPHQPKVYKYRVRCVSQMAN